MSRLETRFMESRLESLFNCVAGKEDESHRRPFAGFTNNKLNAVKVPPFCCPAVQDLFNRLVSDHRKFNHFIFNHRLSFHTPAGLVPNMCRDIP